MPTVHFDDNIEAAMAMLSLGEKPESPSPARATEPLASTSAASVAPDTDEAVPETEDMHENAFFDTIEARLAHAFHETGLPAPRAAALTGAALVALDRTAALCAVRLEDVLLFHESSQAQDFWETLRARLMAAFCALPRVDPEKAALARALVLAVLSDPTPRVIELEPDEANSKARHEPGPAQEDPIVGAYILCRVSEAARADLGEIEQGRG